MHSVLALEVAVGVVALDLYGYGLDTGLVAFEYVSDFGLVALFLAPAEVHTHEHLSPVLRLGAARACGYLDDRAELVLLAAEHIAHLEVFDLRDGLRVCGVEFLFGDGLLLVEVVGELEFLHGVAHGGVAFYPEFQPLDELHLCLGFLLVLPELGSLCLEFLLLELYFLPFYVQVAFERVGTRSRIFYLVCGNHRVCVLCP